MTENRMIIALMDEYQRSAQDLKEVLVEITDSDFIEIRDHETEDPDCKSIQTVVSHVIRSGYTYINYINAVSNIDGKDYDKLVASSAMAITEFDKMLNYTEASLKKIAHLQTIELESWRIESRWDVVYDFEQLMEHAIVHILRHRRQIEQFILV